MQYDDVVYIIQLRVFFSDVLNFFYLYMLKKNEKTVNSVMATQLTRECPIKGEHHR